MEMTFEKKWEVTQLLYGRKCKTFAKNCFYKLPGFEVEDVEQEMLVVLWRCVRNYDPNKGSSFNTFFQQCAKFRVRDLLRQAGTKGRKADVTYLDEEALQLQIESCLSVESAEVTMLQRAEIQSFVLEYGELVLSYGWETIAEERDREFASA